MATSPGARLGARGRDPGGSEDNDDGDVCYVFLGTKLETEYESAPRKGRAKNRDAREDSSLASRRHLPAHLQVATDAQGRRRFHGAFTGGFSAGYFNTVGTEKGFTPQAFVSSKHKRAAADARTRDQQVEDYLDDDELEERKRRRLESTSEYDTFGARAAEEAAEAASFETRREGARTAIPGGPLLMDAMVKPVSNSVGIRMLIALGWRRGKGLGARGPRAKGGESRQAAEVDLDDLARSVKSVANTPIYVRQPKDNTFGLGYDPFRRASEFSERRRRKEAEAALEGKGRRRKSGAGGIGFGVFDEDDDIRVADVYGAKEGEYNFEIVDEEEEEEEEQAAGMAVGVVGARATRIGSGGGLGNAIEGFEYGGRLENRGEFKWFEPPKVPREFTGRHACAPARSSGPSEGEAPPKADPPGDPKVQKTIDSLAVFVARNGPGFEAIAKERNAFDSKFNFLSGGLGAQYYKWRLHEERSKLRAPKQREMYTQRPKVPARPSVASYVAKSTAAPLGRGGRFTAAVHREVLEPQAQVGGLRYPTKQASSPARGEAMSKDLAPTRTEGHWQPEYLLCKRYGVKQVQVELEEPAQRRDTWAGEETPGGSGPAEPPEAESTEEPRAVEKRLYVEKPVEVFKAIWGQDEEDVDPKALADAFLASIAGEMK